MRMDDLRLEPVDCAAADVGGDACKRGKAARVVRPIQPVWTKVGVSWPVIEMRRVDCEQGETGRLAGEDARRPAEQIVVFARRLSVGELGQDRRVAGEKRSDLDAFPRQRAGQRAGHVCEPSGLYEREDLRGDRENFQLAHCASLSIIGWVIKVTPLSVRRNRLASSSGSSPTTRPSGMRTSLSMTAFERRAWRPMFT